MGSHSRPVATCALIRIDLVRRSSAVVRDGGMTEMCPWRGPRHLRYGKPSFYAWQDKTLLNFSLAASLLALLDAHFQLGPFQVLVAESKTSELLTSGAAPCNAYS